MAPYFFAALKSMRARSAPLIGNWHIVLGSLVVITLSACATPPAPNPQVELLIDRQEAEEVVNDLFLATDAKDWERVRSLFASRVHFDMTFLAGGEPAFLSGEEIASAWKKGLSSVASVHHQTGNFRTTFDQDVAKIFCYGTATHYKPEAADKKVTRFVGSYNFELAKDEQSQWKIRSFRFNKKFVY